MLSEQASRPYSYICIWYQRFVSSIGNMEVLFSQIELISVAAPVIQANDRLSFEDDLRSGAMIWKTD